MSTVARKIRKTKIANVIRPTSVKKTNPLGFLSLVGLMALLAYVTYRVDGFTLFFQDFPKLLTGQALELVGHKADVFPTSVSVIFIEVVVSFLMLALLAFTGNINPNGKHAVGDMMREMKVNRHFFNFMLAVALEEVLARGLFLGLFRKIPGLDGTIAFYVLFLLGNGLWALIHLSNFEDEGERRIIKVLPQFVSGFFFTYIFVRYGLFMSIIVHMGCNAVLFSLHKVQNVTPAYVLTGIYAALVTGIAYCLLGQNLSDLSEWVKNPAEDVPGYPQPIPGWTFWDYLVAGSCVSYGTTALFTLLMFDNNYSGGDEKEKKEDDGFHATLMKMTIILAIVTVILLGVVYGLYWFIGLFTSNFLIRALGASVVMAFMQKSNSGSSVSRVYWQTLPMTYLTICVYQVLGFWQAAGYVILCLLVASPLLALKDMHSKEAIR